MAGKPAIAAAATHMHTATVPGRRPPVTAQQTNRPRGGILSPSGWSHLPFLGRRRQICSISSCQKAVSE